jgi:hypothetical protein
VVGNQLLDHIQKLKDDRLRLKKERLCLSKALKVAEKKKSRLKKRARQLSDTDLLEVMHLRAAAAAAQSSAPAPGPCA